MKKKIIWGIVAVAIIAISLTGILYYTTDLFKTPEKLFYKHLTSNINYLGKTKYSDVLEEIKKEQNKSSENAGEITAKIKGEDGIKQMATAVEKGKIIYNVKTVGNQKNMQGDFTLNYDGKDIVTLGILKNNEQYGLKIDEAYNKYVSIENNNLKALFQKLGIDSTNIPNKIEVIDYYELLNIEESQIKNIIDTYSKVIKENIPKECYTVEENAVFKYDDKYDSSDVNTKAYKLTLTEEQIKTLGIKLLETLKNDDITIELILNKYNTIKKSYQNNIPQMELLMNMTKQENEELTKEKLIEQIENTINSLNNATAEEDKALEIIVYGTKEGKNKIDINFISQESNIAKISMGLRKYDEGEMLAMQIEEEETNIKLWIADKKDKTTVAQIEMKSEDTQIESIFKKENKETQGSIIIGSPGMEVILNIKNEEKQDENITVDNFTNENSVNLNNMTESEINNLIQEIYLNITKVLPEKANLLGIQM